MGLAMIILVSIGNSTLSFREFCEKEWSAFLLGVIVVNSIKNFCQGIHFYFVKLEQEEEKRRTEAEKYNSLVEEVSSDIEEVKKTKIDCLIESLEKLKSDEP